jgi:hypothetical protein
VTLGTYPLCCSHSSLRPCRTASLGGNIFWRRCRGTRFSNQRVPNDIYIGKFIALYFDEIVLDLYANISGSHLATPLKKNKKKYTAIKSFQHWQLHCPISSKNFVLHFW